MEQRLLENKVYDIEVTTIHVWARNLLEKFSIKYGFKIDILTESQIKVILNDLVKYYKNKTRKYNLKMNVEIIYSFIMGNKNMDVTDAYKNILKAIEDLYLKYKKDNHLYDFTDFPNYLYDVVEAYNEEITGIDALFVDEFQDVDLTQFKLFDKVKCSEKFYIGDEWQSIYMFRGADGEVFDRTLQKENFELINLKYNYRSYQVIIDYASTIYNYQPNFLSDLNWINESDIKCVRGEGGSVVVIEEDSPRALIMKSADIEGITCSAEVAVEDMLNMNPMILCRTNRQVKGLQELGWTNVSTVHQAKGLEYNNVIVIDMKTKEQEDLNIAYVAITRARDNVMVISYGDLYYYLRRWRNGENE